MSVFILKNAETEGPGTIEGYLRGSGLSYNVVEPKDVQSASLDKASALVVLGGPMGVYEAEEYPHVSAGMKHMETALKMNIPVLGVCLGAQMLARMLGSRVYPGSNGQEVGWHDISLTREGTNDPALSAYSGGRGSQLKVFHWHGDTFDIPEGAERLAGSDMYEAQAFRYGDNAYGLQFHVEVTPDMVSDWLVDIPGGEKWVNESSLYMESFEAAARRLYGEILKHVN